MPCIVKIIADTSIGVTVIAFLAVLGYHAVGRVCTLKKRCSASLRYTPDPSGISSRAMLNSKKIFFIHRRLNGRLTKHNNTVHSTCVQNSYGMF